MKVKELSKGDMFTLHKYEHPKGEHVYIRGEYIRELKKYECYNWLDVNSKTYLKGDRKIYVEFIF